MAQITWSNLVHPGSFAAGPIVTGIAMGNDGIIYSCGLYLKDAISKYLFIEARSKDGELLWRYEDLTELPANRPSSSQDFAYGLVPTIAFNSSNGALILAGPNGKGIRVAKITSGALGGMAEWSENWNPISQREFQPQATDVTFINDFILISGYTDSDFDSISFSREAPSSFDLFTLAVNYEGETLFADIEVNPGLDLSVGTRVSSDGGALLNFGVTADTNGERISYITLVSQSGEETRTINFESLNLSGNGFVEIYDLDTDILGNIYIVGSISGRGGSDGFLAKYDSQLNNVWTRAFAGTGTVNTSEWLTSIEIVEPGLDHKGGIYVAGQIVGGDGTFTPPVQHVQLSQFVYSSL